MAESWRAAQLREARRLCKRGESGVKLRIRLDDTVQNDSEWTDQIQKILLEENTHREVLTWSNFLLDMSRQLTFHPVPRLPLSAMQACIYDVFACTESNSVNNVLENSLYLMPCLSTVGITVDATLK